MRTNIFALIYLANALGAYFIRIPFLKMNAHAQEPQDRMSQRQRIRQEGYLLSTLMVLWFFAAMLLPVSFILTDWFTRLDFRLPDFCYYVGIAVLVPSLWLLWRAHTDLARSWSAVVQIKQDQQLVTTGIYHWIRHPIYSAHLLWGAAQVLLIHNWICGFAGFALIVLIMLLRIPREEKLLIDQYGEEYSRYMQTTGALFPRLR